MKINTFYSLTLGAITAQLIVIDISQVKAANITYDMTVENLSGSLSGDTFTGNFSFNDDNLTGSGSEFLRVFDLSFEFLGTTYTEDDDNSFLGPEVEFLDGNFLGLSYSTDADFTFVPGFFDLSESFFAYDFGLGNNGTGDVAYAIRTTAIPEPTTILGTLIGAVLGLGVTLRSKSN